MGNRTKEVLLLCLAVVTLVVAIYTFRGKPGAIAAGAEQAQAQTLASASAAKTTPDGTPVKKVGRTLPNSTRDPFATPAGLPTSVASAPQTSTPNPAAAPVAAATVATPPLPTPVVTMPMSAPAQGTPPLGVAATPAPAQPAGPALTGVIADPSGTQTAVIRVGDKRYFAKTGDKFGGKYRVTSVSGRQVVLAGTGGKLILKMGGSH